MDREVSMRLVLTGADRAASTMDKLADSTGKAGKQADTTQKKFDAVAAATRQMQSAAEQAAVKQARLAIDPAFAADEAKKAGQERFADRARMWATGAFASSVIGGGMSGAARGLNAIQPGEKLSTDIARVTLATTEGIPILGAFMTGIKDLYTAVEGHSREMRKATLGFQGIQKQIADMDVGQQRGGIRAGARQELGGLARTGADAEIVRQVAAQQQQRLTPAMLAGFRDADFGAARQGAFQAEGGVAAARAIVEARERELAQSRAALARPEGFVRVATKRVDEAEAAVFQAKLAKDDKGAVIAEQQALERHAELTDARAKQELAIGDLKEKAVALQQASSRLVAEEEKHAASLLDIERARLAVITKRLEDQKATGFPAPGGGDLAGDQRRIQDAITSAMADNQAKFAAAIGESLGKGLADLTKAINDKQEAELAKATSEQRKRELTQGIQRAAGGG